LTSETEGGIEAEKFEITMLRKSGYFDLKEMR
jgi:hypothetical protein